MFRPQSEDNKQASDDGDLSDVELGPGPYGEETVREVYQRAINHAKEAYQELIDAGVAKEQARLVMPFATFTEVIWTCSLEAVVHFIKLRNHSHAQFEIRQFAQVVEELTREHYPYSVDVLLKHL
jgi:thymidylate synthase (FAD)